jgi:hypothetical protein
MWHERLFAHTSYKYLVLCSHFSTWMRTWTGIFGQGDKGRESAGKVCSMQTNGVRFKWIRNWVIRVFGCTWKRHKHMTCVHGIFIFDRVCLGWIDLGYYSRFNYKQPHQVWASDPRHKRIKASTRPSWNDTGLRIPHSPLDDRPCSHSRTSRLFRHVIVVPQTIL